MRFGVHLELYHPRTLIVRVPLDEQVKRRDLTICIIPGTDRRQTVSSDSIKCVGCAKLPWSSFQVVDLLPEYLTCAGGETCIIGSPSNWLKMEKISMGYPWDWFKSPFPWVSHGTDLSHQNPWDTHGNVLSHYSWLKLPWYTIPSYLSWDHFKSGH